MRKLGAAICTSLAVLLIVSSSVSVNAQEHDRNKIPDRYRWDLSAIYPSDAAWQAAKQKLISDIPKLREFKGTLASSPKRLADALETESNLDKELYRIASYASLLSDQDTRVSANQAMLQEAIKLQATLASEEAYIEPELLKMEHAELERFISQEPRLRVYRHYLDDVSRRRAHTLSDAEEKLLAGTLVMASAPQNIYGVLSNADFPYPSVTLSSGKTVKLDKSAYELYRASPVREDRQKVMSAFFNALGSFRGTFGATMNAEVESANYYARARKYGSAQESLLDASNIPISVYARLIEGTNRNLPTFHRYLKLRKRMMNLSELHYYDLYAPLVASVDTDYSVEEAQRTILQALAPMGPDYTNVVKRAFSERWIDVYPNEGKRSGGYMNGSAYDVHPYILLNYNGKYQDMSTMAHELGHGMHSYLSNHNQPFALAMYPMFVAEVASTFNEALLNEYLLKTTQDRSTRLALLGRFLESAKGTVFRQAQFAEFELRLHEMSEKGQPLTGDALDKLYSDIVKKYYGDASGVCIVDDYVAHEWAFIPHFYNDFYVYQYATSFTASSALSEKVLSGGPEAAQRYLKFLSSGGSDYPIELLKAAGVDMTTDEPLELTIRKMNRVMDEMEKLLDDNKNQTATAVTTQ